TGVGTTSAQVRGGEPLPSVRSAPVPRSPARSTPFPRSRPGRRVPGATAGPVGHLLGSDDVTTAQPATAPDGLRPVDVLTVVAVTGVTPSVRRVVLSGSTSAARAPGPPRARAGTTGRAGARPRGAQGARAPSPPPPPTGSGGR